MVTHDGLVIDSDPQGGKPSCEKRGVGVDDVAQKELGTHTEYFSRADGTCSLLCDRDHDVRYLSPIGVFRQNEGKTIIPPPAETA
jgi:hypothetical protein